MHGPVRVPDDAEPGSAFLRIALPKTSKFASRATDLEVELVRAARR